MQSWVINSRNFTQEFIVSLYCMYPSAARSSHAPPIWSFPWYSVSFPTQQHLRQGSFNSPLAATTESELNPPTRLVGHGTPSWLAKWHCPMDYQLSPLCCSPLDLACWHSLIVAIVCPATTKCLTLSSKFVMKLNCYHDHRDWVSSIWTLFVCHKAMLSDPSPNGEHYVFIDRQIAYFKLSINLQHCFESLQELNKDKHPCSPLSWTHIFYLIFLYFIRIYLMKYSCLSPYH